MFETEQEAVCYLNLHSNPKLSGQRTQIKIVPNARSWILLRSTMSYKNFLLFGFANSIFFLISKRGFVFLSDCQYFMCGFIIVFFVSADSKTDSCLGSFRETMKITVFFIHAQISIASIPGKCFKFSSF